MLEEMLNKSQPKLSSNLHQQFVLFLYNLNMLIAQLVSMSTEGSIYSAGCSLAANES